EIAMTRGTAAVGSLLIAALAAVSVAVAQQDDDDDDDDAALGGVVMSAPVSLEKGFAASSGEGVPISGKFEIDKDAAQLSVYTAKNDAYAEVIVDHRTGRVAKVIPIVDGNDLVSAKEQMEVMRHAGLTLEQVTASALKSSPGYRAVSVTPGGKDGKADAPPVAKIVLTNGREWKTVYEPLESGEKL